MKKMLWLSLILLFSFGCGSDSAVTGETGSNYNPGVHVLENIDLAGVKTLALKPTEVITPNTLRNGVQTRCDELGKLDGSTYSKLETTNKGNGSFVPCFKNPNFWTGGIYGQYRPADSDEEVWFITDADGNVHHLPGEPRKGNGFKNGKRIKTYKGKPVYLNEGRHLMTFDLETDKKEAVIDTQVGRYLIIPKDNGEHIVYSDIEGVKKRAPDGVVENLREANTYRFYFKNKSNDLVYVQNSYFKRFALSGNGEILERGASAVPVAEAEWYSDSTSSATMPPIPSGPVFSSSMAFCDKKEDLLLCGSRGFLVGDSSTDIEEINWSEFGVRGVNPQTCLTEDFIYYSAGDTLTKINRDLSGHEVILEGYQIQVLKCPADNNLIIHGLNEDNFQYETFQLSGNVIRIIQGNISEIIR